MDTTQDTFYSICKALLKVRMDPGCPAHGFGNVEIEVRRTHSF